MPLNSSEQAQTSVFDVPPQSPEELQLLLDELQLTQARVTQ